jgi:hypothetical protein
MTWRSGLAVALLLGGGSRAIAEAPIDETVVLCMAKGVDWDLLVSAERIASNMFSAIGIRLDWREPRACPTGGIAISINQRTRPSEFPGAMGYSLPFGDGQAVVFLDRIKRTLDQPRAAALAAHVIVHEVTHILQGADRHSDTGIMKGHWTEADYRGMDRNPMPFTDTDIRLIAAGLKRRATRMVAGR